jgi:hypothetical protein
VFDENDFEKKDYSAKGEICLLNSISTFLKGLLKNKKSFGKNSKKQAKKNIS